MSDTATLLQKIDNLDGLTTDEKAQLKNLLNTQKKYGLVWEDKPEEVERQLLENLPVLVEVKERYIAASQPDPVERIPNKKGISKAQLSLGLEDSEEFPAIQINPEDPSSEMGAAPHHILIEGDNLHALTALSFTHKEKIDVIYIDPPYNTGNKDFKYNDSFVDKEDSYRHSKWLSFMHKRLMLAKQLLKETGVIFISIDDNEQAQLKLLCDSVFGESNSESIITWRRRHNQPNDKAKMIAKVAEYILVYAKNSLVLKSSKSFYGLPLSDARMAEYKNPDNDPKGRWSTNPWKAAEGRGGTFYTITTPTGLKLSETWYGTEETFNEYLIDGRVYWTNNGEGTPRIKIYLEEALKSGQSPVNFFNHDLFGSNSEASSELEEILNAPGKFSNPKPTRLLKSLLRVASIKNEIILDFFAGSGSTLHATMKLNESDEGTRQCILVTNNENNIAEEVCYERNKRVISGYSKANGELVAGLKNNHLHYYKAAFVPAQRNQVNRRQIVDAATEIICIRESSFTEVSHKYSLAKESLRLFQADSGQFTLVLYYHRYMDEVVAKAIELVKQLSKENGPIKIYAFAPQGERYEEEFETVRDKISVIPLPEAIYNAYQSSLRRINVKRYLNREFTDSENLASDQGVIDFDNPTNA